MRAARHVQQLLFPQEAPSCPGFDIAGASYPADETGGDYFDYIQAPEGFLDIVIGDVCGHGLGAALLMCSTRAYLRALALARTEIDEVLSLANRALAADMDRGHFVTLLYARLDPARSSLSYTSAGHHPGYVMNAAGEVTSTMDSTGAPLGVIVDGAFPSGPSIDLLSGDLILFFTDGVIEVAAPDGVHFGTDRALQVMRDNRSSCAAELVAALHEAVRVYTQLASLEDDLSAIIIKVA